MAINRPVVQRALTIQILCWFAVAGCVLFNHWGVAAGFAVLALLLGLFTETFY